VSKQNSQNPSRLGATLPSMTIALLVCLLAPLPAMASPQGEADACASLTPAALQQVIDKVTGSLAKAENDVSTNGTTGAYAIAAVYNRDYLAKVNKDLHFLQSWLTDLGLDTPFVTNASAAYNIHGYVREAVYPLHHARHWATISVVYHHSTDAFDSYNLTSEALGLAEALGEQGGRCYISSYFP
jgi:hypothetical protein